MRSNDLLPQHGGFRKLRSFQCAQLVYDGTVIFCDRFIDKKSRTHDQMVQAARSGVQNIAEGSLASATSKKFELKLTGVARASLGELLLDFEDFLRHRKLRRWDKDDPQALTVRNKFRSDRSEWSDKSDWSDRSDWSDKSEWSDSSDLYRFSELGAEELANTLICLINQASYLLWRQLKALEQEFLKSGGFTERMYHARSNYRNNR
ncbi:MAG: four helix bundle suffix domain-containing protein [Candidatus Aminicenantes bacterium]|nr:four helix bundle suffix domain-containing protein [Candidatus Aminicenantes bacterium]